MQHRTKADKALSFFKGLIPDSAEKLSLAKEKNKKLAVMLAKVETKISTRNMDKFILKGIQGIDEVESTTQSAVNKYSKFLFSRETDDLAAAYKGLKSELRLWENELSSGTPVDSYPYKALNQRIVELDKKADKIVAECKKNLQHRISEFNSKLDSMIVEITGQLKQLKQQKELAIDASTLLKEAYQHLLNHYDARIKHMNAVKENFNTVFDEEAERRSDTKPDDIEQLFGMMDAVTLHEGKSAHYNVQQEARAQILEAELKTAFEHDNLVHQIDKKWDKIHNNILTQQIRNNNFLEGFPEKVQEQLNKAWAIINEEQVKLHREIMANKKSKHPDVATSTTLVHRLEELEKKYKEYRPLYRKAEHERRKESEVNKVVTEMIKTIEAATRNHAIDEKTQAAWTTWKQEASILKNSYESLNFMGRYEKSIDKISSAEAEHMAEHFSTKKVDEDLGKRILNLKLSPAQYNQLAASHDLTTRSGRFNHTMHQLFTSLKKFFKSSDEYASTFFAAPAVTKVRQLEVQLEERQKKRMGQPGQGGG